MYVQSLPKCHRDFEPRKKGTVSHKVSLPDSQATINYTLKYHSFVILSKCFFFIFDFVKICLQVVTGPENSANSEERKAKDAIKLLLRTLRPAVMRDSTEINLGLYLP